MNRLRGQAPPQQAQQPKWTKGTLDRVPCPNCGKICDFRNLESQNLLDTGHRMTCEHCGRVMEVVGIQRLTLVAVRPYRPGVGGGAPGLASARPATTISHAQLQRMLK